MMNLDATNLVLGRLATVAAKKALLGEKVNIVNCEKAVITGTKGHVVDIYKRKNKMGAPSTGPHQPKMPDRFVKRTIRGMLPYKKPRGSKAYKNIMCHIGIPDELKDKKFDTIKEANVAKMKNIQYGSVGKICEILGANL